MKNKRTHHVVGGGTVAATSPVTGSRSFYRKHGPNFEGHNPTPYKVNSSITLLPLLSSVLHNYSVEMLLLCTGLCLTRSLFSSEVLLCLRLQRAWCDNSAQTGLMVLLYLWCWWSSSLWFTFPLMWVAASVMFTSQLWHFSTFKQPVQGEKTAAHWSVRVTTTVWRSMLFPAVKAATYHHQKKRPSWQVRQVWKMLMMC